VAGEEETGEWRECSGALRQRRGSGLGATGAGGAEDVAM
jgi:hypothetical protein